MVYFDHILHTYASQHSLTTCIQIHHFCLAMVCCASVQPVVVSLPRSTFAIYRKFNRNLASANADNETFCAVRLTSPVVMIQNSQPNAVSSKPCVHIFILFYLYSFRSRCGVVDKPLAL